VLKASATELDTFDLLDRIEAIKAMSVSSILPAEKEIIFPLLVERTSLGLVIP
jgi:pyruvoyl-dependent arginine decarboxylase (PvlArgDC)